MACVMAEKKTDLNNWYFRVWKAKNRKGEQQSNRLSVGSINKQAAMLFFSSAAAVFWPHWENVNLNVSVVRCHWLWLLMKCVSKSGHNENLYQLLRFFSLSLESWMETKQKQKQTWTIWKSVNCVYTQHRFFFPLSASVINYRQFSFVASD